ncbi:MAG TPA: phosphatidylserine/phosphatidylglycerophosphate/cardiolipin synthase family protein [Verrucomicrobiae bacterium]|nr:phosphatidylserine/phosphatidylglycerophosphate/cardiolipin synthase family protein [Verrucomicrobiae bacterium]
MVEAHSNCTWFCAGDEIFPAMLEAIDEARSSICLEVYIFQNSPLGVRIRDALVRARSRDVKVRVLVDAIGSYPLSHHFWDELKNLGGEIRVFNPLALKRVTIRNHRKLLVCDDKIAFIGGFNVAREYEGDGVACGWCDVGMKIKGRLARQLAKSFDELFNRADLKHKLFIHFHKTGAKKSVNVPPERIYFTGPGIGRNPFGHALRKDLRRARNVQIVMAYFLPALRMRRALMRIVRRGGTVQLILPGKSDVPISLLAARSLYRRLLRAGIEIHEYQPQILHAKLIIVDDAVYVGSANLDTRSARINYEFMVRFENPAMAAEARDIFARTLKQCRRVTAEEWRRNRTFWRSLKQRWAYFLLNKIDPYVAQRQWKALPD